MSDDEMRIAVAKACPDLFWVSSGSNEIHRVNGDSVDPLTSLDAMHDVIMREAEELGFGFQADYQLKLQIVVERRRRDLNREQIGWWMNNATAHQRAEAFLRVKGLWNNRPNEK